MIVWEILNYERLDLYYSTWILLWFALYQTRLVTINPKPIFIFGAIFNIVVLLLPVLPYVTLSTFVEYMTCLSLIKLIPLYYLRNASITTTVLLINIGIGILYLAWLQYNSVDLYVVYEHMVQVLLTYAKKQ